MGALYKTLDQTNHFYVDNAENIFNQIKYFYRVIMTIVVQTVCFFLLCKTFETVLQFMKRFYNKLENFLFDQETLKTLLFCIYVP